MDHEYTTIAGIPEFCDAAIKLALGENNEVIKNNLVRFANFFVAFFFYDITVLL